MTEYDEILQWLRKRHDSIMAHESNALVLLQKNDVDGYRAEMLEKAKLLESMSSDAKNVLTKVPGGLRFKLGMALEKFSASARMSIKLNSCFYMSALLYRDDHKHGEPDNLARFIDKFALKGENFDNEL